MRFLRDINSQRGCYQSVENNFTRAGALSEIDRIPRQPGTYILYAKEQSFVYPWGNSRVFYIGMDGVNINYRVVETHKKHTNAAQTNNRKGNSIYYPVYEYGASYEAQCMYIKNGVRTQYLLI